MEKRDDTTPSSLWTRRSNSKLSLSMSKSEHRSDSRDAHETSSAKRFGSLSSHGKNNPFNPITSVPSSAVASPTSSGAFGLGTGAFASFGSSGKTPKTPGSAFDFSKPSSDRRDSSEESTKDGKRPPTKKSLSSLRASSSFVESVESAAPSVREWPLKHAWIIYYRPPTGKHSDYEKSIKPLCRMHSAQAFWSVYAHLKHPSDLPTVSDYHLFKEGIRPVWEDEENRRGGKWTMRLKKGVADRYWEDLLLALIGDQFAEASEEVCGAIVSVRSGEDVVSIWTKNDGGRNIKIRETVKRVLALPPDTNLQWRSHDESITQRNAVDLARQANQDKRRNTLGPAEKDRKDEADARS